MWNFLAAYYLMDISNARTDLDHKDLDTWQSDFDVAIIIACSSRECLIDTSVWFTEIPFILSGC